MDQERLPDTLNSHWKNDKGGFGYRMLQKLGWNEDKGLGKNEDGIKEAVKVKRVSGTAGVGAQGDDTGNNAWNSTTSSFNDVLSKLKASYGDSSSSSSRSSNSNAKKDKKSKKDKKEKKKKKEMKSNDSEKTSTRRRIGLGMK